MRPTRRRFLMHAMAAPAFCAVKNAEGPAIVSVPNGGIQPQIAVAENTLHLIYFQGEAAHGDVFYTKSEDSGRSFSMPVRVNSQPGSAIAIGAIRGAGIARGKNGRVHVAWNGSDIAEPRGPVNPDAGKPGSPMLYTRMKDDGSGFEPQRNLMLETFGLNGGGSIAADRAGNVYVAWHGSIPGAAKGEAGRQIWIAGSRDDGRTFAKERLASSKPTGACGCCGMRLFADSRGSLYGLYRSATQDVHRDIYLLRSTDGGETFSDDLLHPWNINACPMSSMDIIEAGEVLGAWETQAEVYFAPLARGIAAAKSGIVSPSGPAAKRKYPSLARNHRGETLMAWVEGSGWQRGGTLGWQIFDAGGHAIASCVDRKPVPTWSFPAATVDVNGRFTIVV